MCELDITSTPFRDTKILPYEIELPLSGNKLGFDLLNDEYFTIPYITDTIRRPELKLMFWKWGRTYHRYIRA